MKLNKAFRVYCTPRLLSVFFSGNFLRPSDKLAGRFFKLLAVGMRFGVKYHWGVQFVKDADEFEILVGAFGG